MRPLLRASVAALALVALSVTSASSPCHSHSDDALLHRIEDHLATCLPSSSSLDAFKDALITNELDATQRRPLAVVAMASSSTILDRFAASVATAVAGAEPTAPQAVRVLDLRAAAASHLPAHELTHALRRNMSGALAACAQQRTLFLVRGLEGVRGDKLPLLDVFLDPMNGERATLHDVDSGRALDCRRALFVFLYERERGDHVGAAWRDFLVGKWRASAQTQQLASEAFTPQALAGRLTTAVVFSDDVGEATVTKDSQWTQTCDLDEFMARLLEAQQHFQTRSGSFGPLGSELLPSQSAVHVVLGLAVLAVGLFFVRAKSFVKGSKQQAAHVEVSKAKKNKKKQEQKHKRRASSHGATHQQPDPERIASLRSHCSTPTAHGHGSSDAAHDASDPKTAAHVPVSPASPVLATAAAPEQKTASPDRKTPTPTKPKRTGRGRKASASAGLQATTKMTTRQSRHT